MAFHLHVAVRHQRVVIRFLYRVVWRVALPAGESRQSLREALQVVLHDLRLSKIHPPRRKFNGAQQCAYTGVILMGAGSLLTGLAIYKPTQLAWLTFALGGYQYARFRTLLANHWVRRILPRSYRSSSQLRLE